MAHSACLYERPKMTLDELISAIERLQSIYDRMDNEDQREAKQFVRWAIKHLADKVWSAAL
jgi:nitrogen-specific signal transduction histidine kinase